MKKLAGVVSDKDTQLYKRLPVINEKDRVEIIKSLKYVSEVIFPAPLYAVKFIRENEIDLEVHGFSNEKDFENKTIFLKYQLKWVFSKKLIIIVRFLLLILLKIVNRGYST